MRQTMISVGVALALITQPAASADDDGTIEVLASAIGEVLAIDELCQWSQAARIERIVLAAAAKLKWTEAQQKLVRRKIDVEKNARFGNMSRSGQTRLQSDLCTPDSKAHIDSLISGISFD